MTEQSPTLAEQLREMATWADAQAPVFDKVDGTKMRAAADRLEAQDARIEALEASLNRVPDQANQFWSYLGSWDEWGPRIRAVGLPTCAYQATAHMYGQHDEARFAYCPMCFDLDALAALTQEDK